MGNANKEVQVLERLFRSITEEGSQTKLSAGITDLFVRINVGTGEVALYGDDDEQIASTVIFAWVGTEGRPTKAMLRSLRETIALLDTTGYWEYELFERPFSVVLVDEAFETVEELFFRDDELVLATKPLLEGLDEELSSFLSKILSD